MKPIIVLLVAFAAAACSGAAPTPQVIYVTPPPTVTPPSVAPTAFPSPSGHTLTGTFALVSASWTYVDANDPSKGCHGTNGYSDFGVGMPVTVRDASGATIGTSVTVFDSVSVAAGCVMKFTVASVPDTATYLVAVGTRGSLQYSAADLAAKGWHVALSLGS